MVKAEPTLQQWRELHEAAGAIKMLEPWKYLYDDEFFTIQLPGREEPIYCSVMGAAGECFGIGMYPGNEAFARLKRMANAPEGEPMFLWGLMQTCVNCYYGDREELTKEERAVLKELAIKYRGRNQWVHFRSHKEGLPLRPIDQEEAALTIEVMRNLFMALRAVLEGRIKVDFEKETLFRWRDEKKKDQWFCAAVPWPKELPFPMAIPEIEEEFLTRMNAVKKTKRRVELDVFYLPFPIRQDEGRCPRCFLAVDAISGEMLGQHTLNWEETPEEIMLDFLDDYVSEEGRPTHIHVRSMFTGVLLQDFCKKTKILLKAEGTPALDKVIGEMMEYMGGMPEEDDDY